MTDDIYQELVQPRGPAYRSSQIQPWSHYREPIDTGDGRLHGESRRWGDASPQTQSRVIDTLIESSRDAGLTSRETAYVLAIARVESGFNPDAAAGTTSASGLGQFIDRTGRAYDINASNRFEVGAQADALVQHFIDNRDLARSRGQGEGYIYKYHHDGPTRDYGGLGLANREIVPHLDTYERFVGERLGQTQGRTQQHAPPGQAVQPQRDEPASDTTRRGSFQQTMETMLPGQGRIDPHITGQFGEHRRGRGAHGGTDFNYEGGQAGVNLQHPTVHSPVAGTVTLSGGQYGTVKIRDADGNSHEVLHLNSRNVREGQTVAVGDPIGTMGGRGPGGASDYAQHVHYQMRDPQGRLVSPQTYWDQHVRQPSHGHSAPATAARGATGAMADGVLRHGERSEDIRGMQRSLNELGIRDANGRPLVDDGRYGDRTRESVTAYQTANGLHVDGIAGTETLNSIGSRLPPGRVDVGATVTGPIAVTNPAHADHALYVAFRGRLPADVPDNAVANVLLHAKQAGIDRPDALRDVAVQGNTAFIVGTTPGFRAMVDLDAPAPSMEQVSTRLAAVPEQAQQLPQPQVAIGGR